ncbi:hypothetical protein PG993_011865 [Apiospora rasikravindrae]|uniref:Uncharacterized protein n=1 Tax=Apiospora rasikravindrae TaxID=990691 RepID=A0ABR1S0V1_9PEZI
MQFHAVLVTLFAAAAVSAHGGMNDGDGDMDPNMPGMDMSGSKKNMTMGGGGSSSAASKPASGAAGALTPALMGVLGSIGLVALGQGL